MTQKLRRMKQQDGFTLIELLIVIIILGILAAIVLFGIAQFRNDAQLACQQANARTISSANAAYNARYGTTSTHTVSELEAAGYITPDAIPEC